MKLLLNYADERFAELQRRNCETGLSVAGFDRVVSYCPGDIDAQFAANNRGILSQKRGNGYWLWKPYFIQHALAELADGDFLFYCDSGAHFVASIEPLVALARRLDQDVIPFDLAKRESDWTKRDAFVLLECDTPHFTQSRQRLASFSLWRKTERSVELAAEWLRLAQDERLLTDLENQCGLPNYDGFREHRHDQSLFSLLTKKYGLRACRNPSQHGNRSHRRYPESAYGQLIEHTRLKSASVAQRIWHHARRAARAWSRWLTGSNNASANRPHAA
jgi:hypothetical protein